MLEVVSEEPAHRRETSFHAELKALTQLNPAKALCAIAFDWAVLAAALIFSQSRFMSPWFYFPFAVIIACRQHALAILMHDGAHYRIMRDRRWNDRICDWFLAFPLFIKTSAYRKNHLAHHKHLHTEDDPDWKRKENKPEWQFPMPKRKLFWILLQDLLGKGLSDTVRSIRSINRGSDQPRKAGADAENGCGKTAYYLIAAILILASGRPVEILLLWIVPMLTILPVLLRIRSLARHFGLPNTGALDMSRNYICPAWERFLFCPHSVGYHLDHHLYPSVPFYNLKRLHERLLDSEAYRRGAHENCSLFFGPTSVLRDLTEGS